MLLIVIATIAGLTGCREKTDLERRFAEELSIQKTEEGRKFVTFRYRLAVAFQKKLEVFSLADGVDEFEAWVLADEYRQSVYGICGATRIPEFLDGKWKVVVVVGDPPPRVQPPLLIDIKTGRLQQVGFEPINNPVEWLKHPEAPNRIPEPTPDGVAHP